MKAYGQWGRRRNVGRISRNLHFTPDPGEGSGKRGVVRTPKKQKGSAPSPGGFSQPENWVSYSADYSKENTPVPNTIPWVQGLKEIK